MSGVLTAAVGHFPYSADVSPPPRPLRIITPMLHTQLHLNITVIGQAVEGW
jgi:hypothetical protein